MPKLSALYVALNSWDELQADDEYVIHLVGTVRPDNYADPGLRVELEQGLAKIAGALNECKGISVLESEVRSEADVTLDEVRLLARWHFDYISLSDPDEHELHAAV